MTRPHPHQYQAGPPEADTQYGRLPRRDRPPAAAAGLPDGWIGEGHDRPPPWAPAPAPAPGQPGPQPRYAFTPAPAPAPEATVPGWTDPPGSAPASADADPTAERPDPLVELAASVHLRRAALDRMMRMNLLHARNAWEQRRSDPIAPHVLAMLFTQPDVRPLWRGAAQLCAAWRLWVDGPDARDLPDRLYRYHNALVKELPAAGVVDIRDLATGVDKEMRPDAVYIGLGVSSLDTATGTWQQLLGTGSVTTLQTPAAAHKKVPQAVPVASDTDVPGTVRILLADDAVIFAERRGMCEFDQQTIAATTSLDFLGYDAGYPWTFVSRWSLDADEAHGPVLEYMARLHDLFTQLDQARLVATTSAPPRAARRPRGTA